MSIRAPWSVMMFLMLGLTGALAEEPAPPSPPGAASVPAQPPTQQVNRAYTRGLGEACEHQYDGQPAANLFRLARVVAQWPGDHLSNDDAQVEGEARFIPDGGVTRFRANVSTDEVVSAKRAVTMFFIPGTADAVAQVKLPPGEVTNAWAQGELRRLGIRQLDLTRTRTDPGQGQQGSTLTLGVRVPSRPWSFRFTQPGMFVVISCAIKPANANGGGQPDSNGAPGPRPGAMQPAAVTPNATPDASRTKAGDQELPPRMFVGYYTVSSRRSILVFLLAVVVFVWWALTKSLRQWRLPPENPPDSKVRRFLRALNPVILTQDELGFGSVARLQVFFFTFVAAISVTYAWMRTGTISDISSDLLLLLGIGGGSATASRLVANVRAEGETELTYRSDNWLTRHGITRPPRVAHLQDLFVSGNQFDVMKFQSLVFSAIVGFWVLASSLTGLDSFTVPPHVMALLGISQGLLVGGRALVPGPDQADLNARVKEAIQREQAFFDALDPTQAGDQTYKAAANERLRQASKGADGNVPALAGLENGLSQQAKEKLKAFRDAAFAAACAARKLRYGRVESAQGTSKRWEWPIDPPDDIPASAPSGYTATP